MGKFFRFLMFSCVFLISLISLEKYSYAMVTDISAYKAGDVIQETEIDSSNLLKYFTASTINVGDAVYNRINGKTYVENPNIALSDLRYLKMLHYNFDGNVQVGEMIVNKSIADSTLAAFYSLYLSKYPIKQMHLADDFWYGNSSLTDDVCMLVDNTSCFNYRVIQGTTKISKHSLGLAIDINPHENPYAKVLSDGSLSMFKPELYADGYLVNRESKPYAITTADIAYKVFTANGFVWGGNWNSVKDYQHFER